MNLLGCSLTFTPGKQYWFVICHSLQALSCIQYKYMYMSFWIGTRSPIAASFYQLEIFESLLMLWLGVLTEKKIDWWIDHLGKRCAVCIGQMHQQQTQTDVALFEETGNVSASPIPIDLVLVYFILLSMTECIVHRIQLRIKYKLCD